MIQTAVAVFASTETAAITFEETSGTVGFLMGSTFIDEGDPPPGAPWIETSTITSTGATVSIPAASTCHITVVVMDNL